MGTATLSSAIRGPTRFYLVIILPKTKLFILKEEGEKRKKKKTEEEREREKERERESGNEKERQNHHV